MQFSTNCGLILNIKPSMNSVHRFYKKQKIEKKIKKKKAGIYTGI